MNAERTPLPQDVAAYHVHDGRPCADCANWAALADRAGPRPPWWRRVWRALFLVAALSLAGVAPAWAFPSCWQVAPDPTYIWAPLMTPEACDGPPRIVLQGADAWGAVYLEIPVGRFVPGTHGWEELETPGASMIHFYLRALFPVGDVTLVDPDRYVAQWLGGSDWYPDSARDAHKRGAVPEWGPYEEACEVLPLEPVPEPTSLLLLGTGLALIGWRVRRGR